MRTSARFDRYPTPFGATLRTSRSCGIETKPSECCLIMEGFCLRSKTTSHGHTQILSFHIPGDIPDLESLHLHIMDHDLATLTECTLRRCGGAVEGDAS